MNREDVLLRTKVTPPRLNRRVLLRPDVVSRLEECLDYRITLLQAGVGYGKTTALLSMIESEPLRAANAAVAWYSITEDDSDPERFLAYLIEAIHVALPKLSGGPAAILREMVRDAQLDAWQRTIDALINAIDGAAPCPLVIILDDYHLIAPASAVHDLCARFFAHMPSCAHVILTSRAPIQTGQIADWRARGEALDIGPEALAFRAEDISALFSTVYGMPIDPRDAQALAEKTGGFPIALQLIWQGLRSANKATLRDLMAASPGHASTKVLSEFLTREVIHRQPADVREFLRDSSVLRELSPSACDAITQRRDSAAMLARLHETGLFVAPVDEQTYRYHSLIREALYAELNTRQDRGRALHLAAAQHFWGAGDTESAIYHALEAKSYADAAAYIEQAGDRALHAGFLDTLSGWIDQLPPDVLASHPQLLVYCGDTSRLRSRFDEAAAWYVQAEQIYRAKGQKAGISQALRGQALVYLDVLQPARAQALLQEALSLSESNDEQITRARMLELIADNKQLLGKTTEVESLLAAARALRRDMSSDDMLGLRVKLRTGSLDEAQRVLEEWHASDDEAVINRHRETLPILSLIHAFRGDREQAKATAEQALALGEELDSDFVSGLAHARVGDAAMVRGTEADIRAAIQSYRKAFELGSTLTATRVSATAMRGLTRALGLSGDIAGAREAAAQGLELSRMAGDLWISAHIQLALGSSLATTGWLDESVWVLNRALDSFIDYGDQFGRAAARLWLASVYEQLSQTEFVESSIQDLLTLCRIHGYDFLLTRPTLLGIRDVRKLVPVLIRARGSNDHSATASRILAALGLPNIELHPSYQLRIHMLGEFRVWRGEREIQPREWQRDKARGLFQLLVTFRDRRLTRDEIIERLWASAAPEAAARDFRVALNAVYKALEPERAPDSQSAYIGREGSAYYLRPEADLWLDAAAFERDAARGMTLIERSGVRAVTPDLGEGAALLESALALHRGPYLPDSPYEDWADAERTRLSSLALRAHEWLAVARIMQARYNDALRLCEAIVAQDPVWESDYRLMMFAHAYQGNRANAVRAYQQCADVMRRELNVPPSPQTERAYTQITSADEPPALELY